MALGTLSLTPLGPKAEKYATELSEDSIKTFLALRVINAGLSLAQEVEFTGSVGVLSGSAQPLKVLEPLDDAVEYLSTAIFITGSLAIVVALTLSIAGPIGLFVLGFGIVSLGIAHSSRLAPPMRQWVSRTSIQAARIGASIYALVIAFALASHADALVGDAAWEKHESVLNHVAAEMSAIGLEPDEEFGTLLKDTRVDEAANAGSSPQAEKAPTDEDSGILATITDIGRSTAETASSLYDGTREAATGVVTTIRDGAGQAVSWSRVSAQAAEVILSNANELMIAFFAILSAYIFKLIALPLLAFVVLSRLIGRR